MSQGSPQDARDAYAMLADCCMLNGIWPQDALIMGADYYESNEQRAAILAAGGVPVGIGEGCTITNAIIDKNARIGKVGEGAVVGGVP